MSVDLLNLRPGPAGTEAFDRRVAATAYPDTVLPRALGRIDGLQPRRVARRLWMRSRELAASDAGRWVRRRYRAIAG
jgi:hypothetical protein